MADYVVTVDGYVETANGRSRVNAGRTLSLTEQERAANAHLFVEPDIYEIGIAPLTMADVLRRALARKSDRIA